jgi:hypothetical protein
VGRFVNVLGDINSVLRELFNFKDAYTTKNIDFSQRRIINAHPSVDDYDYVVRKELHDLVGGSVTPRNIKRSGISAAYDKITFGLGIGRSVAVGTNATPPYIWTNDLNGKPDIICIAANICPTETDLIVDIKQNDTSIFGTTKLILPAGTTVREVVHPTGLFRSGLGLFKRYDVFSIDVTQIGTGVAGQEIEVVIFCKLS